MHKTYRIVWNNSLVTRIPVQRIIRVGRVYLPETRICKCTFPGEQLTYTDNTTSK